MSGLRIFFAVFMLLLATSCRLFCETEIRAGLYEAVQGGIILYVPQAELTEHIYVFPVVRDMSRTLTFSSIDFEFVRTENLRFSRTNGYVDMRVRRGDLVREGDILAVLSLEDESAYFHRLRAKVRLEDFLRNSLETEIGLLMAIESARANLNMATAEEYLLRSMQLQLALTEYELFRARFNSQYQTLADALYQITYFLEGDIIYAPFCGMVLLTIGDGLFITTAPLIVQMACILDFNFLLRPTGFRVQDLPLGMNRYGLFPKGSRHLIRSQRTYTTDGGEVRPIVEMFAEVASDPWATGLRADLAYHLTPLDIQIFFDAIQRHGLEMIEAFSMLLSLELVVDPTPHFLTVPIRSVRRIDWQTQYVRVLYGGVASRRNIIPGYRDASAYGYMQIIAGVEENMRVIVP